MKKGTRGEGRGAEPLRSFKLVVEVQSCWGATWDVTEPDEHLQRELMWFAQKTLDRISRGPTPIVYVLRDPRRSK
jgi:hypothetical protein